MEMEKYRKEREKKYNHVLFSYLHNRVCGWEGAMVGPLRQHKYPYHAYVQHICPVGCPEDVGWLAGWLAAWIIWKCWM